MNDLDQMKELWVAQNARFEESIRLNRSMLDAAHLGAGQSQMRRMTAFTALHAFAWFAWIGVLGSFIYKHLGEPRFALAAAALDLYAIGFLIALIRQIVLAGSIDYGQPVAAIQRQVEATRIWRIRATQWAVLVGIVLWAPFFVVICKGLFGIDIYQLFGAAWFAANVLFGVALIPVIIGISKKFGGRLTGSPFMQRVMNDLAGSNLNAASAFLSRLAQFEAL